MHSLLKLRPADIGWRSDLCASLRALGDVDMQVGDAAYQEELSTARELAKDRTNLQAKRDLSRGLANVGDAELTSTISLDKVGDLKLQAGDKDGAHNANALTQRDLAISSAKVGDIEQQTGNKDHALAAYQEALAIFRELAKDANSQAQSIWPSS